MQIHRFDNVSSSGAPRPTRPADANALNSQRGFVAQDNDAEGIAGDNDLKALSRQLDEISDVRPDVVAMAKVRLQRGDYLTRAAAEKTASAILSKDAETSFLS